MIAGVGIDIVELARIRRVLERQGDRFLRRDFTPAEQEYCRKHRDAAPYFAARFAAKEALFKALGTGWAEGATWLNVEIQRKDSGAPMLVLSGRTQEISVRLGVQAVHVSMSHSEQSAVAIVVLERSQESGVRSQ